MTDEKENFRRAVAEDEYAEYDLGEGFVLITDWEGDGLFNPYVVPLDGDDDGSNEQQVSDLLTDAGFPAHGGVESTHDGSVYHLYGVERPD